MQAVGYTQHSVAWKIMGQTQTLGAYIRKRRQDLGLSIREIGKLSGVDYSYISRVERGEYTNVTVQTLQRIAKSIRVPYETLDRVARGLPPVTDDQADRETDELLALWLDLPEDRRAMALRMIQALKE